MRLQTQQKFKQLQSMRNERGFTLLELMMVIAIIAIMSFVAAPSWVGLLNNNAQIAAVNTLVSGIGAARVYAVTHKRPVILSQMPLGWTEGFQMRLGSVLNDSIADTSLLTDNKQAVANQTIQVFATNGDLQFDRLGRVTPANSMFTVCNTDVNLGVVIAVNIFGNAVVQRTADDKFFNFVPC